MAVGRKTGGRVKGTKNRATTDTAMVCRALVDDDKYRKGFSERLYSGQLAPHLEAMIWHYAYGKPKELLEHSGTINLPTTVIHKHVNG